jgi:hypothetical protein
VKDGKFRKLSLTQKEIIKKQDDPCTKCPTGRRKYCHAFPKTLCDKKLLFDQVVVKKK